LALQAEKLAVKAEPYNQRSVSEHQWLLRTTVITHVLYIRDACETQARSTAVRHCPPGTVALTILNASPLQAVRCKPREAYAQTAHREEPNEERRLLKNQIFKPRAAQALPLAMNHNPT
jgi:hypothetical protein